MSYIYIYIYFYLYYWNNFSFSKFFILYSYFIFFNRNNHSFPVLQSLSSSLGKLLYTDIPKTHSINPKLWMAMLHIPNLKCSIFDA